MSKSSAKGVRPSPAGRSRNLFWWVLIGVVVVAGVVAVAVAATAGDDSASGSEVGSEVTVTGTALPPLENAGDDPAVGRRAPELRGEDFDGRAVSTASPGPKVVVFLAHWCPHCQAEVPRIVALERDGGTEGVDVYGVTTGTNRDAPNYPPSDWLEREGWPFPVILDTDDQTAAQAFGLTSYPLLVFVDADGRVAARVAGEVPEGDLERMFAALAAGDPVPVPGRGASSPS